MFKRKSIGKNTMKKQIIIFSIMSLLSVSILSQDVSASILSASDKNAPIGADLLTLNNTSKTPLFWVNSNGKLFAASNADFHNSTSVFDSSKFCIRNPASTFTTCITNGANVANRTLNWPVLSGTDTLATLGVNNAFSGSNSFSGTTDFLQSTEKFGSSGIVIRNPGNTFAYTLTGGAIVANRTLNIPVITGTDTIDTLGLAQTITALKTYSAGITLSGSNNNITTANYQLGQPTAGISFGNGLLFSPTGGSLPIFGIAPGSGTHTAALQVFDNNTSVTNYESIYIGSSVNSTPQFEIGESVAGTGHTRPLYFYMGANKVAAITTAPSFVIGTGSNMTTSSTSGYLYIPVTDGAQTGTPTANTGSVAEYYDGKSNKFCVYNGSWKCVTLS